LSLLALLPWIPAQVAQAAPPTPVSVPVGLPIEVDGHLATAEWRDAVELPGEAGAGTLRVKQARGVLMLGLEAERAWVRGAHLMVLACPDWPEAHGGSPGAVRIDFEPFEHSRPHLMAEKVGEHGASPWDGQCVVRAQTRGRRISLEMGMKLPGLGVTGAKPPGLRLLAALLLGMGDASPTWPAGLDLRPSTQGPPRDMVDSSRWARLTGWVDHDGPGAWPQADWDAWLAADKELATKGMGAHAHALLIASEAARKLEKQDRDVAAQLLEPLAWIALREPLHPYDVLIRGQALRHLNRHEEALACFEALALDPTGDFLPTALGEQATTLERRERYEEAAAVWRALDARTTGMNAGRYAQAATLAERKIEARDKERRARAEDDADPSLPLIELVTTHGSAYVRLHRRDVPQAVAHFLKLAQAEKDGVRTFDGTRFHRVLGDALLQGGDPRTRSGDCDQDLSGPTSTTIPMETNARHGYWRGALAFARGSRPENASQFFILTTPRPALAEEGYTIFGHVVAGMDALDRVERCDTLEAVRVLAPGSAVPPSPGPPPSPPSPPAAAPPQPAAPAAPLEGAPGANR
jgi:cyclophilin family peptidyl-prolyl cis-trans isomerase